MALLGFTWSASAQDEVFSRGDKVINAGVGLGTYISWTGYSTKIPPITGSIEFGVLDLFDGKGGIGAGGYLAFTAAGSKNYTVSDLILGPRGLFHYQFIEKLDTYAGALLGYDIVSYGQSDPNLTGSRFIFSTFIGARYYFTNNIAVYSELGYGIAPLEIGISFKF